MNIDQAKEAATNGKKITHRLFMPHEFISINASGLVFTEDESVPPIPWEWFMDHRRILVWMRDWSIWGEAPIHNS